MNSMLRIASQWICDLLVVALPRQRRMWAEAIRSDVDNIPADSEAFFFALDALRGLAWLTLSQAFRTAMTRCDRSVSSASSRIVLMINHMPGSSNFHLVGIVSAIAAVSLGLAYLLAAGAPVHMLAINAGALILGLAAITAMLRAPAMPALGIDIVALFMSCALLLTALGGTAVAGASRWVMIGALAVQPSLICLPVMVMMFARHRTPAATVAMLIAALAMALQPDRAMAGVLMCGLLALAVTRPDRSVLIALTASATAFIVTMLAPDRLPASSHVDQLLYNAFDVHLLAGLAVTAGAGLLLVPSLYGLHARSVDRANALAFGAIWLAVIVAAALGNYPTPVVGYGGSAIIGYLLCLGTLLAANVKTDVRPLAQPGAISLTQNSRSPYSRHQHA